VTEKLSEGLPDHVKEKKVKTESLGGKRNKAAREESEAMRACGLEIREKDGRRRAEGGQPLAKL